MDRLIGELRIRLEGRPGRTLNLPGLTLRESAVLVPLVQSHGEAHLLFTKRPRHLKHHAGQISFPGGAREPEDPTPLHAALREAEEELGIPPAQVEVLGMLDELPTVTEFRVIPFVGVLPEGLTYRPNPDEVAELIEVPLRHLADPATSRSERRRWRGELHDVHYFDYQEHVIWGATGRILRNLLDVAQDLAAFKELLPTVNIYPVIMAGGSGTRFWPLSRRAKPKQFLALASDRPLIAETADRLRGLAPLARTYVVCGRVHAAAVKRGIRGLPAANVLVEPAARNTAPAIGLATLHVAAKDEDGVIVVLPSDQHVANPEGLRAALMTAARIAQGGRIVTLGIKPTRPETGYGYIQVGPALPAGGRGVKAFKEKPDLETARRYVSSPDFLWNGGIFVFQAKTMLAAIGAHAKELAQGLEVIGAAKKKDHAKVLARVFPRLPNISIDYAVMEKAQNIAVVPGDFGWSDVGSFAALPEVRSVDADGNVVLGKSSIVVGCKGCVVVAHTRPLAVVGLTDVVVVDAGDSVLVVPKAQSQDVRRAVEALKARNLERYL